MTGPPFLVHDDFHIYLGKAGSAEATSAGSVFGVCATTSSLVVKVAT